MTLQFRDPDESTLDWLEEVLGAVVDSANDVGSSSGGRVVVECAPSRQHVRAVPMDLSLRSLAEEAATNTLGADRWQALHSGAVHDAGMMASRMPAAMLFVPSIDGISHAFTEDTREADIAAGAQVYAVTAARMVEEMCT
jgi:N-carbamoyl-L-amino-acid hydrolase